MTPLKFGITLTLIGITCVFLALVAIVALCEVLKKIFKIRKQTEAVEELVPREEFGAEMEAVITASIATYMFVAPNLVPKTDVK